MPDTGKYVTTIIIKTEGGSKSPVSGSKKTDEEKYQEKWNNSLEKGLKGLVSYSAVSSTADNLITYEINQVELRTGAREMEQRMQTVYNFGKKALNTTVALGIGLATGNFPLVAIGAVTSVFNSAISIAQKQRTIDTQQTVENVSINMQNERAGVQGRRGTTQ
jgi:hypothetical protein|nr:MAG TPA: hypothetical protein [Caudoviricetes sp.]